MPMEIEDMPTLQSQIESGCVPKSVEPTGDVRVGDWPERWYHCAEHQVPLRIDFGSLGNGGVVHRCPHPDCQTQVKIGSIPDWSNAKPQLSQQDK
jgi:hypothetical protein